MCSQHWKIIVFRLKPLYVGDATSHQHYNILTINISLFTVYFSVFYFVCQTLSIPQTATNCQSTRQLFAISFHGIVLFRCSFDRSYICMVLVVPSSNQMSLSVSNCSESDILITNFMACSVFMFINILV